ncbi:MAG TPA: hypothetical protein VNM48_03565, partial [Chloroflexota bacterium]|nr:hypothetical protein [Chloroflexota bacterium]
MVLRVITPESLREERRKATITLDLPYRIGGEMGRRGTVPFRITNGVAETVEFDRPLGEMLTTPANLDAIVQKTVIDQQFGREQVPLLYSPLYRTIADANLSQNVDVAGFTYARAVFIEHLELEEIRFGDRKIGPKDTVPIITYAAGFQWTEDMILYDKTWEAAEANRSLGEAYNALLNHIHLYPIIAFAYAVKNQTPADATAGATRYELMRNTLRAALVAQSQDMDTDSRRVRRGSLLLAHSSRRWDIEEALQGRQIGGTVLPPLAGIDTIIVYDGYSIQVGEKL